MCINVKMYKRMVREHVNFKLNNKVGGLSVHECTQYKRPSEDLPANLHTPKLRNIAISDPAGGHLYHPSSWQQQTSAFTCRSMTMQIEKE